MHNMHGLHNNLRYNRKANSIWVIQLAPPKSTEMIVRVHAELKGSKLYKEKRARLNVQNIICNSFTYKLLCISHNYSVTI